jgi:ribosomal protein S18 acetylase RimI-like enzyme
MMTRVGKRAIVLRRPRAAERARVREIVEAAGIFRAAEVEIAEEVLAGAVEAPGKDYWAIGAYEGERLVGFACYGPTPGTEATWDLYWIAVDPAVHRAGTGRRLMHACEAAISERGGRLIVVETASRPDYAPARAFYEGIGYSRAAHIRDYYAPRDDLVIYVKRLVPS